MRIHLLSDIHNDNRTLPPLRGVRKKGVKAHYVPSVTDADVVILAGDIDEKGRGVEWAANAFPNSVVIYALGNHEYWGGHLRNTLAKMKKLAAGTNVHVLEKEVMVIGGVRFVVATGWSDFRSTGNQPLAMMDAGFNMKDHRKIRHGARYERFSPFDAQNLASLSRRWIEETLAQPFDGPTILVTHHPLSILSLRKRDEKTPHLDAAYANSWEHLLLNAQDAGVDLRYAFHGHTHQAVDYEIGATRVIANPVGHASENTGYNPWFEIEI